MLIGDSHEIYDAYVVAKDILYELQGVVRYDLVKHHLLLLAGRVLELLLNEPRTVLVSTELDNEAKYILQSCQLSKKW